MPPCGPTPLVNLGNREVAFARRRVRRSSTTLVRPAHIDLARHRPVRPGQLGPLRAHHRPPDHAVPHGDDRGHRVCQCLRCMGVKPFVTVPAVLAGEMRSAWAAGAWLTCRVVSPCGRSQLSSNQTTRPESPPKWPHLLAINATTPRPRPSSEVVSSPRMAGDEADPSSVTAINADAWPRRHTMTSNAPPLPEAVWARALAASSETHRTASSTAGQPPSVRVTNRRACATCSGRPGHYWCVPQFGRLEPQAMLGVGHFGHIGRGHGGQNCPADGEQPIPGRYALPG
jgi:hypothetical protein